MIMPSVWATDLRGKDHPLFPPLFLLAFVALWLRIIDLLTCSGVSLHFEHPARVLGEGPFPGSGPDRHSLAAK